MNVFVARPHGYCSGVIRAINLAKEVRSRHRDCPVFVLGSIVHNEDVIQELEDLGITTVRDIQKRPAQLLEELPNRSVVIFTAHGHEVSLDDIAKRKEMIVYDATCPMVTTNHRIILNELKNGHQVIYIGKKNHPEANAAASLGDDVFLIEDEKDFLLLKIADKSPLVINQTTLSQIELANIHDLIMHKMPAARIADEICNATRMRQKAVLDLDVNTELVYIIGGDNSSNTASLAEMARKRLPHARVIRILNEREIDEKELDGINTVAVVSGASTPLETTNRVVLKLNLLK